MTPEYMAVNGGDSDKYSRPRQFVVRWYNENNELQETPLRDRELALHLAAVKHGTMTTRSV
jgi:hypothetical protein